MGYNIIVKTSKYKEWLFMTLSERLLQTFNVLPEDKKQQVIDFVEFIKAKNQIELENLMNTIIDENYEALKELGK